MPQVATFHSINEVKKPPSQQVCHNNSLCAAGRDIPMHERKATSGGYRLCDTCADYNKRNQ
jgi:hypothetical protein